MNQLDIIKNFIGSTSFSSGRIFNLTGSSAALLLALRPGPFLAVEATDDQSRRLLEDVFFYRRLLGRDTPMVLHLPAPDGPEVAGSRAETAKLLQGHHEGTALVASEAALREPLWSDASLEERTLDLGVGGELERHEAARRLTALGYVQVPLVAGPGQWSLRGFILDIFPTTGEGPVRAEFFGDHLESIRLFRVETQRSVRDMEHVSLLPAGEPEEGPSPAELLQGVPRYHLESGVSEPPPDAVVLSRFAIGGEGTDAGLLPMGGLGISPAERKDLASLAGALERVGHEHRVLIAASSSGQAERLKEVLRDGDIVAPVIPLSEAAAYEGRFAITVGNLSSGLFLPGVLVLTELEIFGGRPAYRALRKSRAAGLFTTLEDLGPGDFVVHQDRGIGRFEGLVHERVEDAEYDLITISYAENDRLYVPVDSIGKIAKYRGGEGAEPALDSLRSKRWQKTRERVRNRLMEMADRLVRIHAERETADGHAFSADTELHREFDGFFPYEETTDQLTAVRDIKSDMEERRPMERLLCGDVGYGKTEVAMRAAFKAIYDGKQVAVLVPTTLLCEQHRRIFIQRFSGFPVRIEALNRFQPRRDRLCILERLRTGEVDIVIATHALVKGDIAFRDLGLLIIDEEHRFGVRQKERLKELARGVDVLSMSATPIPRTLQMSLAGIRRMSLIETPPEERLAVKTTTAVFGEGVIREALERELQRGGQAFFVHNRIQDIQKVERSLRRMVPLARIAIAHGQMPERELESVMLRFLDREVDVLLSTAIVGSGLDIPTANTIVVNLAHRMGLADLYQLRGRVGRSAIRGYAYFLVPGTEVITEEARMRLQALQEMSYMGAGVRLAMKDLEIRGAGNLLGTQQSGNIRAVGFDLYVEMLEEAVAELRGRPHRRRAPLEVGLRLHAFIPEHYVEDVAVRLGLYRRISAAADESHLESLEAEMADRFGPLPEEVRNLLRVMRLRLLAGGLPVTAVRQMDDCLRFTFAQGSDVSADAVLQAFPDRVRFHEDGFELTLPGGGRGPDKEDASYEESREALSVIRYAAGRPS